MTTLVRRLRKCSCNNGYTREHGGNPMSEGYQCGLCITRREAADRIEELESELSRLRAELSTQETLVATLQEQKYAWDELLGENKFLIAELDAAKRYNHLLATGHDPQCNARDGYACDCGQDNIDDSLRLQWLQDRLRVSSADCNENSVTLSMTVEFWEGVTIGENVPLRDAIDYRLRELRHEKK